MARATDLFGRDTALLGGSELLEDAFELGAELVNLRLQVRAELLGVFVLQARPSAMALCMSVRCGSVGERLHCELVNEIKAEEDEFGD
jgi:hypothetical protein